MNTPLPLCVDLDGTLIRTDTLQETMLKYIWRWPYKILNILLWLCHGRAYLKQRLASAVSLEVAELPFNQTFLNWLKEQKQSGRELILVTASDQKIAHTIANALKIFNATLASDGQTNLRAAAKAHALVKRYGKGQFAYAGNSSDDLKVWQEAGEIIAVNTPEGILRQAQAMQRPLQIFQEGINLAKLKYAFYHMKLLTILLPIVSGYCYHLHPLKNYIILLLASLFLALGLLLLSEVLRMRSLPASSSTQIFKALQEGVVPIPKALYLSGLLTVSGSVCLLFLPLYAALVLLMLGFVWLCFNVYPPHSCWIERSIQLMLVASLFCTALAFL